MKSAKAGKGNVERMVAALRILSTVPSANFLPAAVQFGKPLVMDAKGRTKTKCNAMGWLAQNPYFKTLGLHFIERPGVGFQPSVEIPEIHSRLFGVSAIAHTLELDWAVTHRVFADGMQVEVLRRLRIATTKAGGRDALKAYDESMKPPVVKKAEKAKAKAKKKAAKAKKKVVAKK